MQEESFRFRCSDGLQLYVRAWRPSRVRGCVLIAHGAAEHGGRYDRVARRLASAGFAVYANDHRGHGLTARNPGELGQLAEAGGWDRCVTDLAELSQHVRARHDGAGLTLMGHSMGSFLAQQFVTRHGEDLAALVLSGSTRLEAPPSAVATGAADSPNAPKAGDAFAGMNAAFAPTRTPFDWLSRDPDEVDRYLSDERCGFALSGATLAQMLAGVAHACLPAQLARVPKDLPVYLFAGDQDPVNSGLQGLHALIELYRDVGLTHLTSRFYPGGRHEMLNETNREEVMLDLIAWMNERCPDPDADV